MQKLSGFGEFQRIRFLRAPDRDYLLALRTCLRIHELEIRTDNQKKTRRCLDEALENCRTTPGFVA